MHAELNPALLIRRLGLQPHPEGGHYRETYRAVEQVQTARGSRAAGTAILFLLAAGDHSRWHRIAADEIWHHHGGGALLIHELCPAGTTRSTRLGMDLAGGERPQHVVPAGRWFAAEPAAGSAWSLVGCTVAPGFEFSEFELANPTDLAPHQAALEHLRPGWEQLCSTA
jgi:predicted cupin superfamily sugar epimerase